MIKYIKKFLPNPVKRFLIIIKLHIEFTVKIIKSRKLKRIYILSVPYHGNLGDQAIAYAQVEFLKSIMPNHEIIEIYMPDVKCFLRRLQYVIKPDEFICIHGGGNMGNQYQIEEETRREIIRAFPKNHIISFPETMHFSNDTKGAEELRYSEKIYSTHSNLTIVARENISYRLMKTSFPQNNVILTPDIVLYLTKERKDIKRKNIFICLRADVEGIISDQLKEELICKVKKTYEGVVIGDTVVEKNIQNKERENELEKLWDQFRAAKVVITDRLHGMIFAAITGTPCIVINNYNHKIAGEYEWIKDLEHIRLLEDINVDKIQEELDKLISMSTNVIKSINFKSEFKELISIFNAFEEH